MSEQLPSVREVMILAKQLSPKDRARVLWRLALTLENCLNPELIERETPVSEMCDGMDSATPWDKASVIWWLALTLESDMKAETHSGEPKTATPKKRHVEELPNLEQDIAEMRSVAWGRFST